MCGIVGQFNFDGGPIEADRLAAARDRLAKRGPDAAASWIGEGIGLGHRRLAVLDLTEAGAQPMHSASGRFAIVHNGEVYNFRDLRTELGSVVSWRSESDTEVIVEAYEHWGPACLSRFHGMFAFAIYDKQERTLFLARDRLGVKPMYFAASARRLVFGSRPRALLAIEPELGRELSRDAIRLYAEAGYVPDPLSIYQGIRKLRPGHFLLATARGQRVERYWRPIDGVLPPTDSRTETDLLDELDALSDQVVRDRLVSDVPVGAFLSGGLDSAVVVAKMARFSSSPVKAFTIGFEDERLDETPAATRIAQHLRVQHIVERQKPDDLLGLLDEFLEEFDEPLADVSALPTMAVARLARSEVTVALSGDGGDELFAGYHYYRLLSWLSPVFRLPAAVRFTLARALRGTGRHDAMLLAGALRQRDTLSAFAFIRGTQKDFGCVLAWPTDNGSMALATLMENIAQEFPPQLDAVAWASCLDLATTLPGDYLYKVDGGSMAYSLETREPLLDHRLVEWAFRLATRWKVRGGHSKYVWRRLASRYLPDDVSIAPKRGFVVPLDRWLRGPLREFCYDVLANPRLYDWIPASPAAIRGVLDSHTEGRRNAYPFLWTLVVLAKFLERRALRSAGG
jgi:asparagine synthase (glutamine-hydrolysing)